MSHASKVGIADYLPAPFGLPHLSMPVEAVYPALVPFLTLADGKTYVASEGASHISPGLNGKSLTVTWKHWGRVGSLRGKTFKNGLTSVVKFKIEGNTLLRQETLTAHKPLTVKKWKIAFPLTSSGEIKIRGKGDWQIEKYFSCPSQEALKKSPQGAISRHLIYEASDITFKKNESRSWELVLEIP